MTTYRPQPKTKIVAWKNKQLLARWVGSRIKTVRLRAGLTQEALAEQVEVSRTQITNLETGKAQTTVWTLYRIATACGVGLDEFFKAEDQ